MVSATLKTSLACVLVAVTLHAAAGYVLVGGGGYGGFDGPDLPDAPDYVLLNGGGGGGRFGGGGLGGPLVLNNDYPVIGGPQVVYQQNVAPRTRIAKQHPQPVK